ncbi:MAG: serine/threonine protein kinase [Clostridiales bacterium]|nr:serine/threonine protein kinase [Clostridiales bacterium]
MLKPGDVLWDRYKILKQIGRGGMSSVFLAEDMTTAEMKAVKETYRTAGEAGTVYLRRLSHPGLPRVEKVMLLENGSIIIMEYVRGHSLQDMLARYGTQPYPVLLDWMIQLCVILSYLHSQDPPIIYRDLKPSNVMIQPDGSLKLIDFGAAREYRDGENGDTVLLGTRGYAAPEQYGGYGQSDPRTDIYGLGATIYHLATGRDPSKPPYMRLPIHRCVKGIPEDFSLMIKKCTNLDADRRYDSCGILLEELLALKKCLQGEKTYPEGITQNNDQKLRKGFRHINDRYIIETDITIVYTDLILP